MTTLRKIAGNLAEPEYAAEVILNNALFLILILVFLLQNVLLLALLCCLPIWRTPLSSASCYPLRWKNHLKKHYNWYQATYLSFLIKEFSYLIHLQYSINLYYLLIYQLHLKNCFQFIPYPKLIIKFLIEFAWLYHFDFHCFHLLFL